MFDEPRTGSAIMIDYGQRKWSLSIRGLWWSCPFLQNSMGCSILIKSGIYNRKVQWSIRWTDGMELTSDYGHMARTESVISLCLVAGKRKLNRLLDEITLLPFIMYGRGYWRGSCRHRVKVVWYGKRSVAVVWRSEEGDKLYQMGNGKPVTTGYTIMIIFWGILHIVKI